MMVHVSNITVIWILCKLCTILWIRCEIQNSCGLKFIKNIMNLYASDSFEHDIQPKVKIECRFRNNQMVPVVRLMCSVFDMQWAPLFLLWIFQINVDELLKVELLYHLARVMAKMNTSQINCFVLLYYYLILNIIFRIDNQMYFKKMLYLSLV